MTANPDRACPHMNFDVQAVINRLSNVEGGPIDAYNAEITIKCIDCSEPFRFIGCPAGLLADRPAVSPDEAELRAPIRPASSDPDFGLGIPGFAVTYRHGR